MLEVSDDYLIGFIEGEGMFYVGIVPSRETKTGWQVIHFFKVSQNPSGKAILDYLKKRLKCGYVKPNLKGNQYKDKSLAFVVRDLSSLHTKILPFLESKLVIKRKNFESFKKVIDLVAHKKHLSKQGIRQILDIAYKMNTAKRRVAKSKILQAYI